MTLKSVTASKRIIPARRGAAGFFSLLLLSASSLALAQLPERIAQRLAGSGIKPDAVSIMVTTQGGAPVIEHNADSPFRSASLMKLLTSYAALEILGPAWTWPTEVYALGEIRDGVLHGPLAIKGYGDPSLSIERFWLLTEQLKSRGIRDIKGGLIVDLSHFTPQPVRTDRMLDEPWEIVPAPLLINLQAQRLFFEPFAGIVSIRAEPDLGWIFKLNMPTTDLACPSDVEDQWWPRVDWSTSPPVAYIEGQFPASCPARVLNIGVTDPLYYAGAVFRQLWQQGGGRLEGEVRNDIAPAGLQPYARVESAPLSRAIIDMNKFSSNPMARLIYLSIGRYKAIPGKTTAESADSAIRDWLNEQKLDFPELVQETGSGLSRREQLSARHWSELLRRAQGSRYAAEFTASMPIVGVDGTMSKRLKGEAGMGWGHFKTGTLSDTKTLAGYLTTSRGRQLVVAVQINTPNLGRRADTALEDTIRMLYEDQAGDQP